MNIVPAVLAGIGARYEAVLANSIIGAIAQQMQPAGRKSVVRRDLVIDTDRPGDIGARCDNGGLHRKRRQSARTQRHRIDQRSVVDGAAIEIDGPGKTVEKRSAEVGGEHAIDIVRFVGRVWIA